MGENIYINAEKEGNSMETSLQSVRATIWGETLSVLDQNAAPVFSKGLLTFLCW